MSDQRSIRAARSREARDGSRPWVRGERAAVKLAPLIALAIAGVAAALYWARVGAPAPPQLEVSLVSFEVIREPDATGASPTRESLAARLKFANPGREPAAIALARVVLSSDEDLAAPRSWSTTQHRDAMLRDIELPANGSLDHTFVIPWTGREETRYFPDDARIHLGLEVRVGAPTGETRTLSERFGHVVQRGGAVVSSESQPLKLAIPGA